MYIKTIVAIIILIFSASNKAADILDSPFNPFNTTNSFIELCEGSTIDQAMCVSYLLGFSQAISRITVAMPNVKYKNVRISPLTMIRHIKQKIANNPSVGDDEPVFTLLAEYINVGIIKIYK